MLRKYQTKLRKHGTAYEELMWSFLRNRKLDGFKFRRQQIVGNYIVDFVCYEKKLIIELDGSQHIENRKYDMNRTCFLKLRGFHVMRFWNGDLFGNMEKITDKILNELLAR